MHSLNAFERVFAILRQTKIEILNATHKPTHEQQLGKSSFFSGTNIIHQGQGRLHNVNIQINMYPCCIFLSKPKQENYDC